ncbi:hypothetical protein [Ruminiclostridium cellulolyticum]|uniref:Uncharacterized protein n=1 Tax=Ruminiclostridium cellulolyticum (strain ATCC 35319 / DSM 5812 / JCM 6584 / H10) TaxID=394503 RepID=B8I7L9_RUMCH|nr:hypothetical protein [Ruminiclostridium cellulolyticum]ACL77090.1 hypothetical protein Ccel_2792 [Ruminiclostridium cellulolyticum H10]
MVMNLYILLLVSLPEAFLNLIIALLITGRKENLKINTQNILKFTAAIVLMLTSSWVIRPISPNILTSISLHTVAYSLIYMIVYRLKPIYALFGSSFFLLIITTTDMLYISYVITYIFKGMVNFQNAYHWYVLLSSPQRIVQVIVIAFLWKHEILLATRINYRFHKLFLASFLLLTFGEQLLYFVYLDLCDKLTLIYQIMFSVSMFVIVLVLNILLFKLIYMVIGNLLQKSYKMYTDLEDDVGFALDKIRALLVNNQVDEAVKLIDYITE